METLLKLLLPAAVMVLVVACSPTEAWYKQASGPSYYSVGRASGLLSGIRRSSFVRREKPPSDSGEAASSGFLSEFNSILKNTPLCIKDITPDLQSCEVLQEIKGSLKCKAEVFLSLDSNCGAD